MDIDIPGLPVLTDVAVAMVKAAPIIGGIIVFLVVGIVALAITFIRMLKAKDDRIKEMAGEIAKAKDAHIAMLEKAIPAMHDMAEAMNQLRMEIAAARSGRRS